MNWFVCVLADLGLDSSTVVSDLGWVSAIAGFDTRLEIHFVERGICPVAKSTMNELSLWLWPRALHMHKTAIFPILLWNLMLPSCSSTWFPERCGNFGSLAINKSSIAYFYCTCTKWLYFHFRSKIWHHHRVPRPRFPKRHENFGNLCAFKVDMGLLNIFMGFQDLLA